MFNGFKKVRTKNFFVKKSKFYKNHVPTYLLFIYSNEKIDEKIILNKILYILLNLHLVSTSGFWGCRGVHLWVEKHFYDCQP